LRLFVIHDEIDLRSEFGRVRHRRRVRMPTTPSKRSAFPASTPHDSKVRAGKTDVAHTPLAVRTSGVSASKELSALARTKLGAKLGKYAPLIERVTVRFTDLNGPRGGIDTSCQVKVVLSGLDSIVFEARAGEANEALSLAVRGTERAVRRGLGRAGYSAHSQTAAPSNGASEPPRSATSPAKGSGRSAAAKKSPNAKGRAPRAIFALEGSEPGERPSRKSSRKSANHARAATNLQLRAQTRNAAPTARAERAQAKKAARLG